MPKYMNLTKKVAAETLVTASIYIFLAGIPFKAVHDLCKIADVKTESLRKCYLVQKKAASKISEKTDEWIKAARQNFSGYLQMDTRWSHMRNRSQGLTTGFDPLTRKVVSRSHQVRIGGMRFIPNCSLPSNMMETAGLTEILQEFQNDGMLEAIKSVTRDRDNKSEAIFAKLICVEHRAK